jgi:hypothetical protein
MMRSDARKRLAPDDRESAVVEALREAISRALADHEPNNTDVHYGNAVRLTESIVSAVIAAGWVPRREGE